MFQKVYKVGNSCVVTIPKPFLNALGIQVGDKVRTSQDVRNQKVVLTFPNSRQLPLIAKLRRKKRKESS